MSALIRMAIPVFSDQPLHRLVQLPPCVHKLSQRSKGDVQQQPDSRQQNHCVIHVHDVGHGAIERVNILAEIGAEDCCSDDPQSERHHLAMHIAWLARSPLIAQVRCPAHNFIRMGRDPLPVKRRSRGLPLPLVHARRRR